MGILSRLSKASLLICALFLFQNEVLSSSSVESSSSFTDEELYQWCVENKDQLPSTLRDDLTIENIYAHGLFQPATIEVYEGDNFLEEENFIISSSQQHFKDEDSNDQITSTASMERRRQLKVPGKLPLVPISILGEIAIIGRNAWDVITRNRAVFNSSIDYAGVIPSNINNSTWEDLGPWEDAISQPFRFIVKDGIGIKLSEFEWVFSWKYGASFHGKGKYLLNAGIKVKNIYTNVFQTVTVVVNTLSPLNYGTKEDPIAGIDLQVTMTHQSPFYNQNFGCHFNVRGNGDGKLILCDGMGK